MPFLLLLLNHPPKPVFPPDLESDRLGASWRLLLCVLPEDCEVAENDLLEVSSSLAFLALRAPIVSAC
jgi:hypothetical protein